MPPRTRRLPLALGAVAMLGVALAACTRAPAPQGWAPPHSVSVAGQDLTIAAHRDKLFALPPDVQTATWQFPPKDKSTYPVSEAAAAALKDSVDALNIAAAQKTVLDQKIDQLNISGPSPKDLKDAIGGSGASSDDQSALKSAVDAVTKANSSALSGLKGFYGDMALSSDSSTLYVTAFKGYVYALDPANGHMRWFHKVGSEMIGGVALSADGKTVYYGSKGKEVIAADAATGATDTGSSATGTQPATTAAAASTPAASASSVATATSSETPGASASAGASGTAVATAAAPTSADLTCGPPRCWHIDVAGEVWSTPVVDNGKIYVTSLDGTVYALDSAGKVQWKFKSANAGIAGTPAISSGTLYVGAFDNRLYAINAADGKEQWSFSGGNWFWGTPAVQGGTVFAANLDGKVYAVDAESGSAKWQKPFDTGSPVRSAPAIVGGALIVANRKGEVYKLDLSSGQSAGAPYETGSTIYANLTPAPGDNNVYVLPQAAQLFVLNAGAGDLTLSSRYSLAQ